MRLKKIVIFSILFGITLLYYSCTSSKETSEQNVENSNDSVYVFDQVPVVKDTLIEQPKVSPPKIDVQYYIVQIGAFTTQDKASDFAETATKILKYKVEISFSNSNNLYVVQLTPPYSTKTEAELVRDELWKMEKFKDAWILTVTK